MHQAGRDLAFLIPGQAIRDGIRDSVLDSRLDGVDGCLQGCWIGGTKAQKIGTDAGFERVGERSIAVAYNVVGGVSLFPECDHEDEVIAGEVARKAHGLRRYRARYSGGLAVFHAALNDRARFVVWR